MSLISEALKKAQQEREKNRDSEELSYPEPPQETSLYSKKRLIFIGSMALFIVVVVLLVHFVYQPSTLPQMQALNIKPKPAAPLATPTPPQPTPKPQYKAPASSPSQSIPIEKPTIKSQPKPAPQILQDKKSTAIPNPSISNNSHKSAKSLNSQTAPNAHKAPNSPPPQRTHTSKTVQAGVKFQKETPQQPPAPMDAAAFAREGDQWMEKHNEILAVEAYKKALALSRSADLYLKLYSAFKLLRNPVLMRAYVDEGLSYFPNDYYLNKISAVLYIRAKDFRKAQVNINAAIASDPGDYAIHTYQGLCYFHTGQFTNALTAFQESLKLNSDAVENYYYIGLIFDNQKQYAKALEYYTAFIKLNIGNENFMHRDWVIERVKLLQENQ